MDLRPWNYWNNAGKPRAPEHDRAPSPILERVTKRKPNHPGACHFYIHAIEASNFAAQAVPCAERLGQPRARAPATWSTCRRTSTCGSGRWDEAVEHNAHAVHVDQQYLDAAPPDRGLSARLRPPQLSRHVGGAQHDWAGAPRR